MSSKAQEWADRFKSMIEGPVCAPDDFVQAFRDMESDTTWCQVDVEGMSAWIFTDQSILKQQETEGSLVFVVGEWRGGDGEQGS